MHTQASRLPCDASMTRRFTLAHARMKARGLPYRRRLTLLVHMYGTGRDTTPRFCPRTA